jgi:MFS family permease
VSTASPIYGALADRHGRRVMMLAGLVALVVGAILVGMAPGLAVALVAFALLGFSKASYDPAAQAYLGDAAPYARRGRVLGIIELAWSLSWFIGVPAAGFLIAAAGWRAPFRFIAGLGAAALLATWRLCPECGRGAARQPAVPRTTRQRTPPV